MSQEKILSLWFEICCLFSDSQLRNCVYIYWAQLFYFKLKLKLIFLFQKNIIEIFLHLNRICKFFKEAFSHFLDVFELKYRKKLDKLTSGEVIKRARFSSDFLIKKQQKKELVTDCVVCKFSIELIRRNR